MYAFHLAFKNIISRKSSIVIIIFIAFALALLVLSNAVFDGTDNGIENSYVNSFTGNIVIRPEAEFPLSLFGDETPVTGTLSAIPELVPFSQVKAAADSTEGISFSMPQISGAAAINLNNKRTTTALFGIEGESYVQNLSSIKILEGSAFKNGERGLMLNKTVKESVEKNSNTTLHIGDSIQLIMSDGSSFSIRSVPLTAVYEYEVQNDVLNKISLVDADTLRVLMGMENTVEDDSSFDENSIDLLEDFGDDFDFDSLFEDDGDFFAEESEADFFTEESFSDSEPLEETASESAEPQSTSWNFIVLKTAPGASTKKIIRSLNREFRKNGWQVQAVNWRTAAGSSVYIINYMRIILNVGIILILLTGFIVVNNTLIISALGRIQETGTLKAIGARRSFISLEFFIETAILTLTAGILGCILGVLFNSILSGLNITFTNTYLMQLFGGATLKTVVTFSNILRTMIISLILAVLGWFYPVSLALKTSPVAAMRGQV